VLHDVPVAYSGYAPENYDRSFQGPVTVEYALDHSLNVPAVRCLQQLGKDRLINRLEEAGFRQIRRDRGKLGLSLILGGCGSTLEELTGLFAAFAHEGQYRPLRFTDGTALPAPKRILSAPAAFMIHEMLSKVNRPDFPLNWGATERMPKIAWKTGTSYGRRDAWSIGYNRRYTVGVWAGNFLGQGAPELSGANTATPLLFKIFNTIDYDSEGDWFTPPEGIGQRQVCPETGRVPGLLCTGRVLDYFLPLYSSTQPCAHLEEIRVAPDERLSYCSQCAPETGYKRKAFRVLPPDLQAFYTASGTALEAVPPHNPACEKIFKGEGPKITAPRDGSEYYLSARNPEPLQLAAAVSGDVGRLHWYINDRYYKSAAAGEKLFFLPEEGPVKISCTDDKGRNRDIRIQVRRVSL
jgi:penicillin-binding protein 1C